MPMAGGILVSHISLATNYQNLFCPWALTPNSRSGFRAGVSLNIHTFIHAHELVN